MINVQSHMHHTHNSVKQLRHSIQQIIPKKMLATTSVDRFVATPVFDSSLRHWVGEWPGPEGHECVARPSRNPGIPQGVQHIHKSRAKTQTVKGQYALYSSYGFIRFGSMSRQSLRFGFFMVLMFSLWQIVAESSRTSALFCHFDLYPCMSGQG